MTTITSDINFQGEISFKEEMKVSGQVEGIIRSKSRFIIASDGKVKGEIYADQVEIYGNMAGNIDCKGTVKIGHTGKINGDIRCLNLDIKPGANINGSIIMK